MHGMPEIGTPAHTVPGHAARTPTMHAARRHQPPGALGSLLLCPCPLLLWALASQGCCSLPPEKHILHPSLQNTTTRPRTKGN